MATTSTALTKVTWTDIFTIGFDRDIIAYYDNDVTFFMGLHVDPLVLNKAVYFVANFQIQEVRTKQTFNNYWVSRKRGSLGVAIIGKSLAQARGLLPKHAIKQVDRLLSNRKLEAWDIFATWVPELVGSRTDLIVAMDWTDYDADGQATLALKLVTRHGRATPLVWLSVLKDELKDARNDCEDACLRRLAEVLPAKVRATILADRASPTPSCSSSSASWASTT